jgi:ubiquinone/menaquinone biosynthesis C-methylase UbiE
MRAKMFNRRASTPKNKPDTIVKMLDLQPGQHVADIGSGGGYFSLRFANVVGKKGMVYAVDTNADFLEYIEKTARERGLSNLTTVLIKEDIPPLPKNRIDLIFIRNVCHHIENRPRYFKDIQKLLSPNGKIAIIDYTPGGFSFRRIFGHYIPQERIVKELEQAGYTAEKTFDFLPEQSFTIFSLKK